jgi:tetratricopeptide (TPR) repeat protein
MTEKRKTEDEAAQAHSHYENVILEFINGQGVFAAYTTDKQFLTLSSKLLYSKLNVQNRLLSSFYTQQDLLAFLKTASQKNQKVIVFVERLFAGRPTQDLITSIKAIYDNVFVIVLTQEVEKEVLVKLFEAGVDKFITKPLSMTTLVEKIAFTLKPQSKLVDLIEKAKDQLAKKRFEQCLRTCDEILAIKPNSAAAYMVKGDVCQEMGLRDEAIGEYLKAHEHSKLYLEPLRKLADFYGRLGEKEMQLEYLRKMDKLSPLNTERKVLIGVLSLDLGEREDGRKFFDAAVSSASQEARENICNTALQVADQVMTQDPGLAEQYYRRALEAKGKNLSIGDVETFNRLGICLRQQKRPMDAITEYSKALEVFPDHERLLYNISLAYMEADQMDEAMSCLEKLFSEAPEFYRENEAVSHNIGMMYLKNREREKAVPFFRTALELNKDYAPSKKMLERLGLS